MRSVGHPLGAFDPHHVYEDRLSASPRPFNVGTNFLKMLVDRLRRLIRGVVPRYRRDFNNGIKESLYVGGRRLKRAVLATSTFENWNVMDFTHVLLPTLLRCPR